MELLKKLKVSRGFALRGALGGIGVAMWLPGNGPQCGYLGSWDRTSKTVPENPGLIRN
jgi:hypothetical protein